MQEEDSKRFVIDASFMLTHLLPDESVSRVDEFFIRYRNGNLRLVSSPLLPLEVANGLRSGVPKRLTKHQALAVFTDFTGYGIELKEIAEKEVLLLSLEKGLTVYDASYVWLSREENIPLLSLDTKLAKLAR